MVPDIDGDGEEDEALCFDVGPYDPNTGRRIGQGRDCLANIEEVDGGIRLVGTTFFRFRGRSMLVTRGLTTVQPILHGANGFTDITAAPPSGDDILCGRGWFRIVVISRDGENHEW